MTEARAGPAAPIRIAIRTSASAVQTKPRTATAAKAPPLGAALGQSTTANGVRIAAAIVRQAAITAVGSRSIRWRLRISGALA